MCMFILNAFLPITICMIHSGHKRHCTSMAEFTHKTSAWFAPQSPGPGCMREQASQFEANTSWLHIWQQHGTQISLSHRSVSCQGAQRDANPPLHAQYSLSPSRHSSEEWLKCLMPELGSVYRSETDTETGTETETPLSSPFPSSPLLPYYTE
jgi:hypothetical protein